MPPVRVAIIEAQTLFANALEAILGEDDFFTVVADLRSLDAIRLEGATPDIVVIDLDGQPTDLAQTIGVAREKVAGARVCALTIHASSELMERCFVAGADAFVLKDISPAEFLRALRTVAAGDIFVDARVAGGVLRARDASGKLPVTELSARESDVLKLIAEGLANKQISARLHLSEKTVKNHVSRIFAKLNITARTQAAVHAIRTGIV